MFSTLCYQHSVCPHLGRDIDQALYHVEPCHIEEWLCAERKVQLAEYLKISIYLLHNRFALTQGSLRAK